MAGGRGFAFCTNLMGVGSAVLFKRDLYLSTKPILIKIEGGNALRVIRVFLIKSKVFFA